MEMQVKCNVCGKILAIVDKPQITDEDKSMYSQTVSCDVDGQSDIQTLVAGE